MRLNGRQLRGSAIYSTPATTRSPGDRRGARGGQSAFRRPQFQHRGGEPTLEVRLAAMTCKAAPEAANWFGRKLESGKCADMPQ